MADFRMVFTAAAGQYETYAKNLGVRIATATTDAMKEAADIIKRDGRANIASAGFSKKWQNALRVNVYPDRGRTVSVHAAALAFHKIPYASIFETGGAIGGSPLLWLPLPNVPTRLGNRHMSPANYVRNIGPLHSIYRPGRVPLLAGYMPAGSGAAGGKITIGKLKAGANASRRGGSGSIKLVSVPLFYGLSQVNMKKRLNLIPIFRAVESQLGALYLKNFKE